MKSQGNGKLKKKVFVGMSGGVDSSVSAALLKKEGYDVTGVFIKVWQPNWIHCTWKEDRLDAMRVAALLKIPFITLDLEKEYKREVVDYMIAEYKAGKTPNPDVMCNRHVKFGGFYNWARSQGADYVATGHYAEVKKTNLNRCNLNVSHDSNKDQTYFLWTLTQEQLAHTLFPIGHLTKPEVRKLAKEFKLPTAEKKDSQGLCFIGKIDVKEFLGHYIKQKKGKVLDTNGEVIGEHDGAYFFTEGQRHGFLVVKKGRENKPLYVVGKNIKANTITVAEENYKNEEEKKEILIENCNWTNTEPELRKKYSARIRYRQPLKECHLEKSKTGYKVIFKDAVKAVSPGQSLVLYDREVCIGGGVIR